MAASEGSGSGLTSRTSLPLKSALWPSPLLRPAAPYHLLAPETPVLGVCFTQAELDEKGRLTSDPGLSSHMTAFEGPRTASPRPSRGGAAPKGLESWSCSVTPPLGPGTSPSAASL